jgi:diaminopimelate decarboxylase
MSIATRTAHPTGAAHAASGAAAVDSLAPVLTGVARRHELPLVVIDLPRAARQYRAIREAFPWVDVHYDVSALAHPALLQTIASGNGSFAVSHDSALPATTRTGADPARILHTTRPAHPQRLRAAWTAGVRRFVVGGARELEAFAGAPADVRVLLRLSRPSDARPAHRADDVDPIDDAVRVAQYARDLGAPLAGLSLDMPAAASVPQYAIELSRATATMDAIATATGARPHLLDLGSDFPGATAGRPPQQAELARAIRSLVAPVTSKVTVIGCASRSVTTGCIAIVGGTIERDADPATASECIDAGAEVVVLREDEHDHNRFPHFRRARTTWSPAC